MDVCVYPATRLEGVVHPPSSKNYTTRYLLAAALTEGESLIRFPAESEDATALKRCLTDLGAVLTPEGEHLRVRGFGANPRNPGTLNPGNAGAVLRFLMAVCAATLDDITFVTDYVESLGKRPQGDLLDALKQLGAEVESRDGRLPIRIRSGGPRTAATTGGGRLDGGSSRLRGGTVRVSGEVSSQYTSALLFAAPLIGGDLTIEVTGDMKSRPPIRQTLQVLREAGIRVEASDDLRRFHIPGGQRYRAREYTVPGDYPGAAALMAAAAVVPSDVTIPRLFHDEQGERQAVEVLAAMGADIAHDGQQVRIRGGRPLRGGRFDGDPFTDAVLALTAAAVLAEGETVFYNVENLRYKECDRISDYRAELNKLGARVGEERDKLIVAGRPEGVEGGVAVESRIDHRVIMGLTIVSLRAREPVVIRDAHHVAKSYPAFFDDLRRLGARIDEM
ncbi:3-phosphoshikimate 1-carboxyvinyltransferase [Symbiobacterium terraclitae]|uniref:3-phosphoshikimate 1-carboxyvinyltransferase n=1 Tax=Symbiobacterium terraclitae TaxID=557451 RepID=A0ABS4JUR6_9FIRM|nr:3-phosphoshikimate 1-carboxyvinyltransferase [Symbiobacterium terraclitae]MBP2019288.1 3-phosphoshikimate 1-carboxyvinyltransferase [Symbiobacterium terraclitae]